MKNNIFSWFWGAVAFVFLAISIYITNLGSNMDKQLQTNQETLLKLQKEKYLINEEIEGLDNQKQAALIETNKSKLDKLVQDEFDLQTVGLELQEVKNEYSTLQSYLAGAGLFLTIAAIALAYAISSEPKKKKSIQLKGRKSKSKKGIYIPANQKQLARDLKQEVEKYKLDQEIKKLLR
ncbi:hypothetical protein [Cytobacillus oceanisediminis]|uniref:Uncharacterized protein n=1 Tax=Cytobacillus oceanisediminis TaxID=665099 RepID=A0ABX3CKH3_9BACI|nr:hypothetical protein [Cytobacillus oceanisediminis]OHX41354.1 hypothetical protein BBV17_28570 [Cytobacillus oceanisediminis]